jgi:hypothetical protein
MPKFVGIPQRLPDGKLYDKILLIPFHLLYIDERVVKNLGFVHDTTYATLLCLIDN